MRRRLGATCDCRSYLAIPEIADFLSTRLPKSFYGMWLRVGRTAGLEPGGGCQTPENGPHGNLGSMGAPRDLSQASDQAVVALVLNGKAAACRELMDRYRETAFYVILGIVGHRERAEDLTQETFIKMFRSLDQYRPERSFGPWLRTIARNTALNYVKVDRFDSFDSPILASPSHIDKQPYHMRTLVDTTSSGEYRARDDAALVQAIGRLRPAYRRVVILRFGKKRSYKSIARIMKVPKGTVGTHLRRALMELKEMLAPSPDSWPSDPAISLG